MPNDRLNYIINGGKYDGLNSDNLLANHFGNHFKNRAINKLTARRNCPLLGDNLRETEQSKNIMGSNTKTFLLKALRQS